MTFLTKEDLIGGIDTVVEMEIPGKGQVKIRPLSTTEYQAIQERRFRGLEGTVVTGPLGNSMKLDLGVSNKNDFEADCLAVAMALVEPRMSVDEVKKITGPGTIGLIAKKVYEISGISEAALKEIEKFRGQS